MILSKEIKASIDRSILCWLATVDTYGMPNVSPKEIFTHQGDTIIIANIASPNSRKNIESNPMVCVSFIHNYIQKGYQIKGEAKLIERSVANEAIFGTLDHMTKGAYPFDTVILINSLSAKEIIAPSYFVYPDEPLEEKIEKAKAAYHRAIL